MTRPTSKGIVRPPANRWSETVDAAPPPHPDAVLTPQECAAWLKLERRALQRVGVPHLRISHKVRRYRVRDVSEWLDRRAACDAAAA